ncbi:MAG TPA: GH32 C-terminal domain-containing protein, partial [Spirochaetia bacterium]|nr:GH32 C-terminal domain-containing protein [Spirochaetia bacterium]
EELGSVARQVQCIAIGDGTHYRKLQRNPVIESSHLPVGASLSDFRDPKLWREADTWYCLVATRNQSLGGELLLFAANDLERWHFVGVAADGGGTYGTMWECPDFFATGDSEVLVWSPQNVPQDRCRHRNANSSVYSVGILNRESGSFDGGPAELLDFGPDFYAPQTLRSPDGRRILIAWMQMWDRTIPTDELHHGWAGSMTIPREVEVCEDALVQRPVRELEAYRVNRRSVDGWISGERKYQGLHGHCLDLEVVFEHAGATELGLALKHGREEETVISYSVAERTLTVDRSRSGIEIRSTAPDRPDCMRYCCDLKPSDAKIELRIILDRSSCEIFADGGRKVISATLYPSEESDEVVFFSHGGPTHLHCTAWEIAVTPTE